jgi:hypothetical protein
LIQCDLASFKQADLAHLSMAWGLILVLKGLCGVVLETKRVMEDIIMYFHKSLGFLTNAKIMPMLIAFIQAFLATINPNLSSPLYNQEISNITAMIFIVKIE